MAEARAGFRGGIRPGWFVNIAVAVAAGLVMGIGGYTFIYARGKSYLY